MCALSPLFPSDLGWPLLVNPADHEHNLNQTHRDAQSAKSFESPLHSPPSISQFIQLDPCASFVGNRNNNNENDVDYGDPSMVKKLSHNASERDRRRKLNALYSSLRSLLPATDQTKKLSIPATVSRVVKYIPELQQEVERLSSKRDEIQKRVWRQGDDTANQEKKRERVVRRNSTPGILVTRLAGREISIQISTIGMSKLSNVLTSLEEYGLCLMSASSFVSSGKRWFYNLHLEMEGSCQLSCEEMSDKLSSLYDKKDELLPWIQVAQV